MIAETCDWPPRAWSDPDGYSRIAVVRHEPVALNGYKTGSDPDGAIYEVEGPCDRATVDFFNSPGPGYDIGWVTISRGGFQHPDGKVTRDQVMYETPGLAPGATIIARSFHVYPVDAKCTR
jgi:hypothetical protein